MSYLVYKHTSPSGKVYIGITSRKETERWNNGRGYAGSVFYNAVKKYGWENIQHEVLFRNLTQEEAIEKERELIELYNSTNKDKGYNIVPGGGLGIKGYKFTEDQIRKLQESHKGVYTEAQRQATERRRGLPSPKKGIKQTQEQIEKNRQAHIEYYKSHTVSDETRAKLSKAHSGVNHWNYGRHYSEEYKQKLSLAHIGQESKTKKAVICLETKEVFKSESAANKAKGYKKDSVGKVCRGDKWTVNELHWMYLDEYNASTSEEIKKRLNHKGRCKKVRCIETGQIFNSGAEAAKNIKVSSIAVTMCCRGINHTCGGYHWEFVEEVEQ